MYYYYTIFILLNHKCWQFVCLSVVKVCWNVSESEIVKINDISTAPIFEIIPLTLELFRKV